MNKVRPLLLLGTALSAFLLPNMALAQVSCPTGYDNPTDPSTAPYTYQTCTATDGSGQTVRVYTQDDPAGTYKAGQVVQNIQNNSTSFADTAYTPAPTVDQFQSGTSPDGSPLYTLCRAGADCITTGALSTANLADYQRMGYTQTFDQAKTEQNKNFGAPTSCASYSDVLASPITCFWRGSLSFLGAGIVWIVSWTVVLAGMLFNWAVEATINDFTGLFYTPEVNQAVADVWTNIRDLSNILIIGIFVFIAISIILGLQEYGQKKLIARVIIVSILINFSFLFTQIAINTSNLFATQILAAHQSELHAGTAAGSVTLGGDMATSEGIAGEFLKFAGATTFGDTWNALSRVAENNQSAWVALLHGIMVAVLLLLAAAVLFYGAFLLLSRGVMLIFLLMTSAFAFATYLSPGWADSDFGFRGWRSALARNVVLAPAMMLFLWASLSIANKLAVKNGTLGQLVGDPQAPAGIAALFSYFVIIGLLYGSLKLSSSMAGATGRLALGGISTVLGVTGGATALGGRWFIGGRAAANAHGLDEKMKSHAKTMATLDLKDPEQAKKYRQLRNEWATMNRQKGRQELLAKSSFNVNDTKLAQKLHGAVGGPFVGKSGKSYEKTAHAQDDKTIKEAIKAAVDNDSAKKLAQGENKSQLEAAQKAHEDSQKLLVATKENADSIKNSEKLLTRLDEHRGTLADATAKQADSAKKFDAGKITQAEHDSNMAAQKARIDTARNSIDTIQRRIKEIDAPTRDIRKQHQETAGTLKELDKRIATRAKEIQSNSSETAADIGRMHSGGPITRFWRNATDADLDPAQSHHVAEALRKQTRGDRMARAARTKERSEDTPSSNHGHETGKAASDNHAGGDAHAAGGH